MTLTVETIGRAEAVELMSSRGTQLAALMARACTVRDQGVRHDSDSGRPIVTYSRKVFIPLTNLCRDVCGYCTFARSDDDPRAHTMSPDEVLQVAEAGARRGCKEALFCLGDRPEVRWPRY